MLSPTELYNLPLTDYFFVVDIRPSAEFAAGAVMSSNHLDLSTVDTASDEVRRFCCSSHPDNSRTLGVDRSRKSPLPPLPILHQTLTRVLRELVDRVEDENPPDDFRHAFVIGSGTDDALADRVVGILATRAFPFRRRVCRLIGGYPAFATRYPFLCVPG